MSRLRKTAAVLRLPRGEDLETVSRSLVIASSKSAAVMPRFKSTRAALSSV